MENGHLSICYPMKKGIIMNNQSHSPKIVDNRGPEIIPYKILEINCPNPNCNKPIDITDLNEGTKIECPHCMNITWTPSYKRKNHGKISFIIGLLISFILGICSSLIANYIYNYSSENQKIEKTHSQDDLNIEK